MFEPAGFKPVGLTVLFGLLFALLLVPISRRLAFRADIVDRPGHRKLQGGAVPLLGGVALLLAVIGGVLLSALFGGGAFPVGRIPVAIGALCVFLVGLTDDLRKRRGGLGARGKFCGQLLAVLLICSERSLALISGSGTAQDAWALLCLLFLLLSVINAVNVVDNMNGLAAGLTGITVAAGLLLDGQGWGDGDRLLAAALVGGLLGFLPFNFPRARSYLGDAGSYLIGSLVAVLALQLSTAFLDDSGRAPDLTAYFPALLLVGLPLFDLTFSVVRRILERRPIFCGDTRHLSHRLVGAGLTPARAVLLLLAVQVAVVCAGWFCFRLGSSSRILLTGSTILLLSVLSALLVRYERRHRGLTGVAGAARNLSPEEYRGGKGRDS